MAALRLLRRLRRRKRPANRLVLQRPVFHNYYSDSEYFSRFRFVPNSIQLLCRLLSPFLQFPTNRNRPLPVILQLCAALRYLSGAGIMQMCADFCDISTSSVCRCIWRVINCLTTPELLDRLIKFPADMTVNKRGFHSIANFPNVIGAIDGTQIPIMKPDKDGHEYINRKGFASINVQMVCDHNLLIQDVVANWPGSIHDSRIFRTSKLAQDLENGEYGDSILLGDSGYCCKSFLLTPYIYPEEIHQKNYNSAHMRTRVVVEQTFGVLKKRFAILQNPLKMSPARACNVVRACAMLHNFGLIAGDVIPINMEDEPVHHDIDVFNVQGIADGHALRDHIALTCFQ